MQDIWDKRYAMQEYIYGIPPNEFFRQFIEHHPPGKILLPGEGEGRNAIYAALKGWQVEAFDFSENAMKKAMKLADNFNTHINYTLQSINDYKAQHNSNFDAVALIFLHLSENERIEFFHKAHEILKPNGKLLIEGFSKEQLRQKSGGPKDIHLLYDVEELIHELEGFRIVFRATMDIMLHEGILHQGESSLVRIIAEKI